MNKSKFWKYFLFFTIPALTVMVSAKQPSTHWETVILIGLMALQGCIGVKALQSDPNTTGRDKSNNMNGDSRAPEMTLATKPEQHS